MAAAGAYYLLEGVFVRAGRVFLRVGVTAGAIACAAQISPPAICTGA